MVAALLRRQGVLVRVKMALSRELLLGRREAVAAMMKVNRSIKVLNLARNGIRDREAEARCDSWIYQSVACWVSSFCAQCCLQPTPFSLRSSTSLRSRPHSLRSQALAASLEVNRTLTNIDLSHNCMCSDGAQVLQTK